MSDDEEIRRKVIIRNFKSFLMFETNLWGTEAGNT